MLLLSCGLPSSRKTSVLAAGNSKFTAESNNHESLKLGFHLFDRHRRKPNSAIKFSSYTALLQECSRQGFLQGGLQLHSDMIKRGLESDSVLLTRLLNLYIKCDRLHFARRIFDYADFRTSILSWNSMITAYCRSGLEEEALSMFFELQMYGWHPDEFTLSIIIKAAEFVQNQCFGKQIHSLSIKRGYDMEEHVGNSLIQMYASFQNLADSCKVFRRIMELESPVSWNSLIHKFVENGYHDDAIELYKQMQENRVPPTPRTLTSVLKACAALKAVSEGRQAHAQTISRGFLPNLILETSLVDFYSKNGEAESGRRMLERMEERNAHSWNSLIRGYSQLGQKETALKQFQKMRMEGVNPDNFTFPLLLSGPGDEETLQEEFRSLHAVIIKSGLQTDRFVATSLIAMYSEMHLFEDCRLVFSDANSLDIGVWSSIISASTKNGEGEVALGIFRQMLDLEIEPNQFIFSSLFTACGNLSAMELGKQIHAFCLKSRDFSDTATQNSLINMYSSCGWIEEAVKVFDSMKNPNVISFNSIILALAQNGYPGRASEQFKKLELLGFNPDEITTLNLLTGYNHAGLVKEGLDLFSSMEEKYKIKPRYQHHACIVDLLARAGEIEESIRFMAEMPSKPETSLWRVVLGACTKHKRIEIGKQVAQLLLELEPREATNYVLLANNYARAGKWIQSEKVRQAMKGRGIEKEVGLSWIENNKRIHRFGVEDRSHPLSAEIYTKLRELVREMKEAGYVPDVSYAAQNIVGDDVRGEFLHLRSSLGQ